MADSEITTEIQPVVETIINGIATYKACIDPTVKGDLVAIMRAAPRPTHWEVYLLRGGERTFVARYNEIGKAWRKCDNVATQITKELGDAKKRLAMDDATLMGLIETATQAAIKSLPKDEQKLVRKAGNMEYFTNNIRDALRTPFDWYLRTLRSKDRVTETGDGQ